MRNQTAENLLGAVLADKFEIAGLFDVRNRLLQNIKAADVGRATQSTAAERARTYLHDLHSKLITRGIEAPETKTIVKDWRLIVFSRNYRRFDEPIWHGDIVPCGPGKMTIKSSTGMVEECYQWKAGINNIGTPTADGCFSVRIQVHDDGTARLIIPWVALGLSVLNLVWRIVDWISAHWLRGRG